MQRLRGEVRSALPGAGGGGWGRAKGERWRLWPAAGCPAGLPGRGEGPGWNLMVTALPEATVAEGTKKGREEMGSRPASS